MHRRDMRGHVPGHAAQADRHQPDTQPQTSSSTALCSSHSRLVSPTFPYLAELVASAHTLTIK